MVIDGRRRDRRGGLALPGLLTLAALVVGAACRPSGDGIDRASLPAEVRADYEVFAHRCSKCHSLARPLTSGITDNGQWEAYVTRMRMQPGSGITARDQEIVLRFLRFYSAEELRKKAQKSGLAAPAASVAPAASGTPSPTAAPSSAPAPAIAAPPPAPSAAPGPSPAAPGSAP